MASSKATKSARKRAPSKSASATPFTATQPQPGNDHPNAGKGCSSPDAGSGGPVADLLDILGRDVERQALVTEQFSSTSLSDEERQLGLEILEIMARNVERQVREAFSEHVRMSPFLPPSVASRLADEVGSEALPIIQNSSVLSDEDLIAIVCNGSEEKQVAVARRATVAPDVADALVETGSEKVVSTLLSNPSAEITERSLLRVLREFGESGDIQALIVDRLALPLELSEALIARISQVLRERLVTRHQLPCHMADQLTMHGREKALTQMLARDGRVAEIARLAAVLHAKDALTPTLILRALCAGNLEFFEAAMAARTGLPLAEVGRLIFESGRGSLDDVYRTAGLPDELFVAFRAAVDVIVETRGEDRRYRPLEITEKIMVRLRQEYDSVCPEGLEHTLSQLTQFVLGRDTAPVRGLT